MNPVQFHPSPLKDGRRVLGEKPANACLSPTRNRNMDAAAFTSPVRRPIFDQRCPSSSPKKLFPSPSSGLAGQKRTFDQVDENRPVPVNKGSLHVVREAEETRSTGENAARSSQKEMEPEPPHAMNTSKPQEQKQTSPIEITQDAPSMNVSNNPTRTIPEDPETRKVFIQEKANLLRSRIQSAMRHVRDHQFDRRLSELEAHSRKYPRSTRAPRQTRILQKTTTNTTTPIAISSLSETEETTPRTLQPAPELKPSRVEEAPTSNNNKDDNNNTTAGLSSPPLSTNNTTAIHDPMRTPTQQTYQHNRSGASKSPMQLSSPPASISRDRADQHEGARGDHDTEDVRRTPSQQGDAVDGLLKLMNTAERREHSA